MIPPLLVEACKDRRLRGAPIHLLLYLHTQLEYTEYRTVKQWVAADAIGTTQPRVSQALKLLIELGYLRIGPTSVKNRKVGSYLLINSRATADTQRTA